MLKLKHIFLAILIITLSAITGILSLSYFSNNCLKHINKEKKIMIVYFPNNTILYFNNSSAEEFNNIKNIPVTNIEVRKYDDNSTVTLITIKNNGNYLINNKRINIDNLNTFIDRKPILKKQAIIDSTGTVLDGQSIMIGENNDNGIKKIKTCPKYF